MKMMQPYVRGGTAICREREPFAREAVHKLERKDKREIIHEKDRRVKGCNHRWRRTLRLCHDTPRGEGGSDEKEDTVGSITMVNGAMFSTLMG
jgi:hypothetical protein